MPAEAIQSLDFIPGGFDVGVRPRVVGHRRADDARPAATKRSDAGRGLADRRRPARAGHARHEDPLHVRAPPLDDRLRAAVAHPRQRRPLADDGAELLRRPVPHRPRAHVEVAPRAVERRHDRHVRALRDEGHRRRDEAVLQPHAVPAAHRARRSITTVRGPRTSRCRACCPSSSSRPARSSTSTSRSRRSRRAPRSCARATKALGLTNVEWRAGGEAQVGRDDARHRAAARAARGRADVMALRSDGHVATSFNGTFWIPDFARVDARSPRTSIRASASTLGVRGDAFARAGRGRARSRAASSRSSSTRADRAAVGGRVSPAARVPERAPRDELEAEHSTQTIAGLQYEPHEGARVQASAYYTDRTHLITHEMDGYARQRRPRHDRRRRAARDLPRRPVVRLAVVLVLALDARRSPRRARAACSRSTSRTASTRRRAGRDKRWQLGGRFQLYSGLPYTPAIGSVFDSDRNLYIPLYGERELRARADPPPARPARRLLVEVGPDGADRIPRRPERLHERERRHVLLRLRLHAARGVQVAADHPVARPARCAVKRAASRSSRSSAATRDVDEPWQLDHDRIIAVRATPPRILPGEQSTIDLLVGFDRRARRRARPGLVSVVSPMSLADLVRAGARGWSPHRAKNGSPPRAPSSTYARPAAGAAAASASPPRGRRR